jgi:hypothetical protein
MVLIITDGLSQNPTLVALQKPRDDLLRFVNMTLAGEYLIQVNVV